jgi:diacylglycerol O-acyltransferase
MHRLSGEAAGFLSLELPIQPMSIMALAVLRPARGPDGSPVPLDLSYVGLHMASRLDELPAFRWRVVPVPFGLQQPVLVEDQAFDLGFHLREHVLGAPGSAEELDHYCAGLAEQALDRRHPLWQLVLVHGLHGGRQVVVLRIHHCLMDGFAAIETLSRIFPPGEHQAVGPGSAWCPGPPPSPWRLIVGAAGAGAKTALRLPALVGKTLRNNAALGTHRAGSVAVPKPGLDAPPSLINQAFTADRRFARTSLSLAAVTLVKEVAGASVNDVALAVVAGSLRSYLQARSALPARPLVAAVPVGMEEPGATLRTHGNRFSGLVTSLATDVDEPWDRLLAITAVTAEAKRQLAVRGLELLPDWLDVVPPALVERAVRHYDRRRRRHPARLDVNVVISNIRGPSPGRCLGAAVVEEMYVAGPPNNGVGINVALMDYGDRLFFALLCFADSVEVPGELVRGIHHALAELVGAARAIAPHRPSPR